MSDAKEIRFFVEQEVLDAGVKIVFAVMEGIDNRQIDPRWTEERQARIRVLTEKYRDLDVHEDAVLEGFNLLHDHTGVKRRKNIPASENLIRLLKKNGDVFFINTAVDIYNIISMETKLALGRMGRSGSSLSDSRSRSPSVPMNTVTATTIMKCCAVWRSGKWKRPR